VLHGVHQRVDLVHDGHKFARVGCAADGRQREGLLVGVSFVLHFLFAYFDPQAVLFQVGAAQQSTTLAFPPRPALEERVRERGRRPSVGGGGGREQPAPRHDVRRPPRHKSLLQLLCCKVRAWYGIRAI
jgi:hypothetical protein